MKFSKEEVQATLDWLDAESTVESHRARDIIEWFLDDKPYVPLTLLISARAFEEAVDDLVDAHYTKNVRQSITDQLRRIIEKAERRGANNGYQKLNDLVKLGGEQQKRLLDSQFELVGVLEKIRELSSQALIGRTITEVNNGNA